MAEMNGKETAGVGVWPVEGANHASVIIQAP